MLHLRRWPLWFWCSLLLLVSVTLRGWQITGARMWYDEINTWWIAALPPTNTIAATAGDVHPPLYYLLAGVVLRALPGLAPVLALRGLSLIFSLAAFPLTLMVGRALKLSNTVMVGALVILTFAPFQLYYAQEARMYTLLQCELLLGLWAVLTRRWPLFALAMALTLYTHNYGVIYLAVLGGLALGREWWQPISDFRPSHIVMWSLAAVAAYLPWVRVLAEQAGAIKNTWWLQPTSPGAFVGPLYTHVFYSGLVGMFDPIAQIVTFGLVAFALARAIRRWGNDSAGMTLAYLTLAPMLLAWLAEWAYRPIFLQRALIGTAAPLYLLIAWATLDSVDRFKRLFAWGVFAPLLCVAVLAYYPAQLTFKGMGYSGAQSILPLIRPGDVIYHINPGTLTQFYLDWPDKATPQYIAPNSPNSLGTLTPQSLNAMGIQQVALDDLHWRRVFLVWNAGPTTALSEDEAVSAILARYPHVQIDTNDLNFKYDLADGGVWLLWR